MNERKLARGTVMKNNILKLFALAGALISAGFVGAKQADMLKKSNPVILYTSDGKKVGSVQCPACPAKTACAAKNCSKCKTCNPGLTKQEKNKVVAKKQ